MHKLFFVILCMAIMAWASPLTENGALSFNSEGRIVNERGTEVQLRGMSLFWDQWASGWFNENVVKTLASTDANTGWSASVVRAPISQYDASLAKKMIDWTNTAGIYVIIDNHSHCAHRAVSQAETFFSEVSSYVKQKGYKHVIYELYNEPLYENCSGATDTYSGGDLTTWATIKSYALSVIPKIRNNDANGLILVGTPRYSQDVGVAQKDPITGYKNIGYVLHFYASESGHSGLMTTLLRARCQNFPVFITEWGTSPASGDGNLDWSSINTWMAWIEGLGYSWANWSIYDKNETASAIASGGSSGYWQEGQLTASGKFVRKMMKGFGSGSSYAQLGLTEPSYPSCSIFDGASTYEFVRDGEGEFKIAINAENYNDSLNIQSVQDTSVHAMNDIYINTSGEGAWAKYKMNNVPADGFYRLAFRYQAPNKDLNISYTIEGVSGEKTLTLPQTTDASKFSTTFSAIELKEGTSYITFDLGGVSANDLLFDAFWATYMDSTDSVTFGLVDPDNKGEEIDDGSGSGDNGGGTEAIGITKRLESGVSLELHGRVMDVSFGYESVAVNILDLQGRVLVKRQVHGSGSLDLNSLRPGAYLVQLKGSGMSKTKRIQLR